MRYQLYVYGTTAVTGSAMAIGAISAAIGKDEETVWNDNDAAHFMREFDVEDIKTDIERELGDKCRVIVKYPPSSCEQKAYLYISTSYEEIREVLPIVYSVAIKNALALYDAEKDRNYYMDLIDESFISLKVREQAVKDCIINGDKRTWDMKKISCHEDNWNKKCDYVVTFRMVHEVSFEERIKQFYNTLMDALTENEELICENECFVVKGKNYAITFCLEIYKKDIGVLGYYEDRHVCTRLLNRMGCSEAIKWISGCSEGEKNDICARMHFIEMVRAYPNPADRFVSSVNITKWQRKELFDIRYSGMGEYGSEILFHIAADSFRMDEDRISVLKIEEESASFILPFVEDVYPYIYVRYNLTENYLTSEMWEKIIERISEAKEMILNDTFNPILKSYIKKFNLFTLLKEYSDDFLESDDAYKIKNEPEKFLYEHRYDVAHLYDVFIEWSQAQIKHYCEFGEGRMFNIQGP